MQRRFIVAIVCVVCLVGLVLGLTLGLLPKDDEQSQSMQQQMSDTSGAAPVPAPAPDGVKAAPWPHEESDIPPDPKVRFGTLANGMRYMIMPHAEPPEKLALRLHVDAGSFQEEEDQQGLVRWDLCIFLFILQFYCLVVIIASSTKFVISTGSLFGTYAI